MTLVEFVKMWESDPAVERLTQSEDRDREEFRHILFHVLYRTRTPEYGRHAGLRVKVDRMGHVVEHSVSNFTIDQQGSWIDVVQQWYNNWSNIINVPIAGTDALYATTFCTGTDALYVPTFCTGTGAIVW